MSPTYSMFYYVGFDSDPIALDHFLDSQGFQSTPNKRDILYRKFTSPEQGSIDLFYFTKSGDAEEGDVPDWRRTGLRITSELMIAIKESDVADDALKLGSEVVKRFEGILYDPSIDKFLRTQNIH